MDARLVQLLTSFLSTTNEYTLARLEFASRHPNVPAPPLIERLPQSADMFPPADWESMEDRLELVRRYLRNLNDQRGKRAAYDQSFAYLQRTYRELDQYARAIRWVMTVEDRHPSS
jgi:acyl carrier protein phosphodiesterase